MAWVPQFNDDQLREVVRELEERYAPLHEKIRWRQAHFHNLDGVNPKLPPPFDQGPLFQSDLPRRIHAALKARLGENHFVVNVTPPRDTAPARRPAQLLEQFLNDGLRVVEDRTGIGLQDAASDGQIISAYAVLHWTMAEDIWPAVPEAEYLDEAPDAEVAGEYTPLYADEDGGNESDQVWAMAEDGTLKYDDDGLPQMRAASRWRETDDALQARHRRQCAHAGFPWMVEYIAPDGFMAVEDRSLADGYAMVVTRRVVPILGYVRALEAERERQAADDDDAPISVNQVNPKVRVYGELASSAEGMTVGGAGGSVVSLPTASSYTETVTIYEVWTRDEFYEIASGGRGDGWAVVKSGAHPYGRPPFVVIPAQLINHPDPVLRYEPALEGVFRLKPFFDRQMSLLQTLSEQVATPYYYWRSTGTGEPLLNERGDKVTFTRDAAASEKAPEGYELAKLDFEVNQAFVQSVDAVAQMLNDAAPPTGKAEISASTQPWAIRLQQAAESVEPGRLVNHQARGIKVMCQNMVYVHSLPPEDGGFAQPVHVFGRTKDGKIDKETTQELRAKDVVTLDIDITIKPQSAAEAITAEQHGMDMYQKGFITMERFAEDYAGWEDPDQRVIDLRATQAFETKVMPGMIDQIIAEEFGQFTVLSNTGQWVGYGGQALTPQQVMAMKRQQQPGPGQAPGTGGAAGGMGGPQMPQLAGLTTPGTMPLGGMPG